MDLRLLVVCIAMAVLQVEAQNYGLQPNQSPISGKDGFSKLNETIIEGLQEIARLVENTCPTLENIQVVRQEVRSDIDQQSSHLNNLLNNLRQGIQNEVSRQITHVTSSLNSLAFPLGATQVSPARSCRELRQANPNTASGYYWIQGDSQEGPLRMFCDMTRRCNGVGGGWMKVAKFDIKYSDQSCPSGLRVLTDTRRRCVKYGSSPGCGSTTFPLHGIEYQKVCGKILGYQVRSTDAFHPYHKNHGLTIDGSYVDGVSLTHGHDPRQHIWTFASAYGETLFSKQNYYACPCSYRYLSGHSDIPPFVGNNYFCDSGNEGSSANHVFTDPLWDGAGCTIASTCCSLHNPPWFRKTLPSATNQDIEMRLCHDQDIGNEDIGVESVELYVQ